MCSRLAVECVLAEFVPKNLTSNGVCCNPNARETTKYEADNSAGVDVLELVAKVNA